MIVVKNGITEERGLASAGSNLTGAAKVQGRHVTGRGLMPGGEPAHVRVTGVHERFISSLHLVDERRLLAAGVGNSTELELGY